MLLGVWVAIAPCLLGGANAGETGRVTPNRTLPKVAPPKTALEFSANPTAREIAEPRVFQEPLVPAKGRRNGQGRGGYGERSASCPRFGRIGSGRGHLRTDPFARKLDPRSDRKFPTRAVGFFEIAIGFRSAGAFHRLGVPGNLLPDAHRDKAEQSNFRQCRAVLEIRAGG